MNSPITGRLSREMTPVINYIPVIHVHPDFDYKMALKRFLSEYFKK